MKEITFNYILFLCIFILIQHNVINAMEAYQSITIGNQHEVKTPYECETCHKEFDGNHNLTIHIRTHTGEKPYVCHLCDKKFTQQGHLTYHLTTPHKIKYSYRFLPQKQITITERPYRCTECNRSFSYQSSLESHIIKHRETPTQLKPHKPQSIEEFYQCPLCNALLAYPSTLKYHMTTHNPEKLYSSRKKKISKTANDSSITDPLLLEWMKVL